MPELAKSRLGGKLCWSDIVPYMPCSGVVAMLIINQRQKRLMLLLFAVSLPAPAIAQHPSALEKAPDVVWTWSGKCNASQKLSVTVRLENNLLYKGFLPICRGNRSAEDGRVAFHFTSNHLFGDQYRARKSDTIEGDIWQAGGEADALILGISLATKKQVMLNTLHVAKPDKQTTAELDKGLYITTSPVITR